MMRLFMCILKNRQTHHADKTTKHRMILLSFQSFILTWRATLALKTLEGSK